MKRKEKEKLVKKTLDLLIEKAENYRDLVEVKFSIDDYISEGYFLREQIQKYNNKVLRLYKEINQRERFGG